MLTQTLNGWSRVGAISAACFATWLASAQRACADITVVVTEDIVDTRVAPLAEIARFQQTSTYRISTDKGVDTTTATSAYSGKSHTKLGQTVVGETGAGQPATSAYRIVNGAVVVTTHSAGLHHVLKIRTDGHSSCSATRSFFRTPGRQYFEAVTKSGVTLLSTDIKVESSTCSITARD